MTYWLVNSGTTKDPLSPRLGAVSGAFTNWETRYGPVHGVDRAYSMTPGDVLIYRSVGTPVSRLVAFAEVTEAPVRRPFLQWNFQVRRNVVAVIDTLRDGPAFDLLGVSPVRMTKRLDDAVGSEAVRLIRRAAKADGA